MVCAVKFMFVWLVFSPVSYGCLHEGSIVTTPAPVDPDSPTPAEESYLVTVDDILSLKVTAQLVVLSLGHSPYRRQVTPPGYLLPSAFIAAGAFFSLFLLSFLAHLSTKCSGWAIVTSLCPSSVVVRRAASVVRRAACSVCKLFCLNIFSSETTHWILTKLHRNNPWLVPYQSCSNGSD